MQTKNVMSALEAAAQVKPGDRLLVGGFGMTGAPVSILEALAELGTVDLEFVGNNLGEAGMGGGKLLRNGQISKAIGSFFTSNIEAVEAAQKGDITTELLPQGTLAEAIRAGGAGLGGFFTPTSAGTLLAANRETRMIGGVEMVFVPPIRGNVALIRAWRADTCGNLQYRMTENNFNQVMATAADYVVAEVEEIVAPGKLSPECIHTPGCFVDALVQYHIQADDLGSSSKVTAEEKNSSPKRLAMAKAALAEIKAGDIVNLGIGIPTLVAEFIDPAMGITLHTENGMLGIGPSPTTGGALDYPVNAGKVPVTAVPGTSYFDSSSSFAMIRGGHVDVAIMGALQVDQAGNLANWAVPGKPLLGVGGAMDLAAGAKKLVVTMSHTDPEGNSKVVPQCSLPLTASSVVDVIITDLAVFEVNAEGLILRNLMPGVSLDRVREHTDAPFEIADTLEVLHD